MCDVELGNCDIELERKIYFSNEMKWYSKKQ